MTAEEKGVYIYANLLDINHDGKIDMISFLIRKAVELLWQWTVKATV